MYFKIRLFNRNTVFETISSVFKFKGDLATVILDSFPLTSLISAETPRHLLFTALTVCRTHCAFVATDTKRLL